MKKTTFITAVSSQSTQQTKIRVMNLVDGGQIGIDIQNVKHQMTSSMDSARC
jgi:hypothetical protein